LEEIVLNGESQVLGGEGRITVPADKKRIEFHYTTVNFRSPEKVRFRYCLEGYDKQWHEHGSEKDRVAHYMNVPGGTYRFQVIACNNDGVWNEQGASIEVRIIPALTETLWFKAIALIGLFSLLYLIFSFLKRYFYFFAFWKKRTLVGHYVIDRIIGYGGMATVFLAHHVLKKERIVAVKILKREFAARSSSLKRFKQEGSIIDRLDHPHIVKTFERGQDDDNFYIVMEYLQGRTLAEKIKEEKVIKTEEYVEIAKQVVEVLAALHGRNIIHRDLKPANIMVVEEDGRKNFVKVLDFGLARSLFHTCITESGSLLGTILYIPPEQISHSVFSPAGDIYALGMISCEMLTGTTPYADCPPLEIMQRKLNEASVEPASLRPGIPSVLNQLIKRMTDPDPRARPTAQEILDILAILT